MSTEWFLFAFDHRDSFRRMVGSAEHADVVAAKALLFDGFRCALDAGLGAGAAILIDEEYGSGFVGPARAAGARVVMPVERSGQQELGFEYGEDAPAHIERFDPDAVKVLLRWDPAGDAALNARQGALLAELSSWMDAHSRTLIVEVLVPPSPDSSMRADVTCAAIAQIHAAGTSPAVWKLEGLDEVGHSERVADALRAGGRDATAIVLGRGVDMERATHWLECAAAVPTFCGFAIGKTLWQQPMQAHLRGATSREAAVLEIASRYCRLIDVWRAART